MGVSFTKEQRDVIDARRSDILVSAAAGSGKTAVLVERIIELITKKGPNGGEPVDVDKLLVVTFTRAAAAQMRERLSNELSKRIEEDPMNEHLRRQETLIHNAQITTIDSFCQYIIRNNFNEIGIDPGYRVADEGEIKLICENIMEDFLEKKYEEEDEEFLYTSKYFESGVSDKNLEDKIMAMYKFSKSMPYPKQWIKKRANDYEINLENFDDTPWVKEYLSIAREALLEMATLLQSGIDIANSSDGPYFYAEIFETEMNVIKNMANIKEYEKMYVAVKSMTFSRLPSKKDDSVTPNKKELAKDIRDNVKASFKKLSETTFAISKEDIVKTSKFADRALKELCALTIEFMELVDDKKKEQNIIDFGDMEHFALDILVNHNDETGDNTPTSVATEYSEYFEEILIDEYQDSNSVQELILSAISKNGNDLKNRFMVGDVKQSIYKFRLAKPEIFMKKLYSFSKEEGAITRRIDLHKNFRSRSEVLDSVNFVFDKVMGEDLGGVIYDDDARLVCGASYKDDENEHMFDTKLILLDTMTDGEEDGDDEDLEKFSPIMEDAIDENSRLTPIQKEALLIAKQIKKLMKTSKVTGNDGELRNVKYSDIAILLRTTSGWDDTFRKVLESEGIPSFIESKTGYFAATEVELLLNVLKVIDNPLSDIPLVAVMHSYFGKFSNDELALIKSFGKKVELEMARENGNIISEKFYDYLKIFEGLSDGINDNINRIYSDMSKDDAKALINLADKVKDFLERLYKLRDKVTYMPVHELLSYIINESGYGEYVRAMPAGARRYANVDMLMQKAIAFEKTSFKGLFHFIRYIERLEKYEVDFGEANIIDENADVVRIMSIHKSKGLEFPICFVAAMSKKFNFKDANDKFIMDEDVGIGMSIVDYENRCEYTSPRKVLVSNKMKMDILGEELRVLYVAMTRAKEKLIMVGTMKDTKAKIETYLHAPINQDEKLLPIFSRKKSTSYMAFVLSAIAHHKSFLEFARSFGIDTYGIYEEDDDTPFEFEVFSDDDLKSEIIKDDISALSRKEKLSKDVIEDYIDKEMEDKLLAAFDYSYPHKKYENLYTKTSVSEIKRKAYEEDTEAVNELYGNAEKTKYVDNSRDVDNIYVEADNSKNVNNIYADTKNAENVNEFATPFDIDSHATSAAARGTLYHKVMQLLDGVIFDKDTISIKDIQNFIEQKENEGYLESGTSKRIYAKDIQIFLESSLGNRMKKAFNEGKLYREKQFMIGKDSGEIDDNLPSGEIVLIQGVIDAFFEEDGEIVLVDYKTDNVKDTDTLVKRYNIQLSLYKEAVEKITKKKVKSCIIYSFKLQKEIEV